MCPSVRATGSIEETCTPAGKNGFKVLHGEGPGEGLFVEELIESFGLREYAGIVGAVHHGDCRWRSDSTWADLAVE